MSPTLVATVTVPCPPNRGQWGDKTDLGFSQIAGVSRISYLLAYRGDSWMQRCAGWMEKTLSTGVAQEITKRGTAEPGERRIRKQTSCWTSSSPRRTGRGQTRCAHCLLLGSGRDQRGRSNAPSQTDAGRRSPTSERETRSKLMLELKPLGSQKQAPRFILLSTRIRAGRSRTRASPRARGGARRDRCRRTAQ